MTITAQGLNPQAPQPISLLSLARSLLRNYPLIAQLTRREVLGRYIRLRSWAGMVVL